MHIIETLSVVFFFFKDCNKVRLMASVLIMQEDIVYLIGQNTSVWLLHYLYLEVTLSKGFTALTGSYTDIFV